MTPNTLPQRWSGPTSMYFSRSQTPIPPQKSNKLMDKEEPVRIDAMEIDNGKGEFYDPEVANVRNAKRPMILTLCDGWAYLDSSYLN
jgi:hypothetical protein